MSASFDFPAPDHFTAGTMGPPGQRVFFLQAREDGIIATLRAEKEQVRALGAYLERLLAQLRPGQERAPEDVALLEPVDAAWAVRELGVGYDEQSGRIVIEAVALREREDEADADEEGEGDGDEEDSEGQDEEASEAEPGEGEGEGAARARFRITREQAEAFVGRVRALMKAGRKICPICGQPKDPGGHVCAGLNGHIAH